MIYRPFHASLPTILFAVLVVLSGCSAAAKPDYTLFRERLPKSILVVAPINQTASIEATSQYMPTISSAVAERGYYVFPVLLVDQIFKENGVVSPAEIRQVSAAKLQEVFGADAFMDISISDWGTTYLVIHSQTEVAIEYQLIDLASGEPLWSGSERVIESSQSSSTWGNAMVDALTHAVSNTAFEKEVDLAQTANFRALHNRSSGLLSGPRAPQDQSR